MNLSENIHNAFSVVFKTFEATQNLIEKCKCEYDKEQYYMPTEKFLRYHTDSEWQGWIYWSIILLYQRKEDGIKLDNGWIDGPVYAVEINFDAEIYQAPLLNVARFEFSDMEKRVKNCSPNKHDIFNKIMYEAVEGIEKEKIDDTHYKYTVCENVEDIEESYWGFKSAIVEQYKLVDITADNYKEKIFGSIENLHNRAMGGII